MTDPDAVQEFDVLLDELVRIERAGGHRFTLDQVRAALARMASRRIYLRARSLRVDEALQMSQRLLAAGWERPQIVAIVREQVGCSRTKAYRSVAKALALRVRRPC